MSQSEPRESARVSSPESDPLLALDNLTVSFGDPERTKPVVDRLSLEIRRGEVLALVGESGSGKSLTALAIMRLLPRGARITGGQVRLEGRDLLAMPAAALNAVRGGRVGMLFQQPQRMLDPTMRVGAQIAETLLRHRRMSRAAAHARAIELLREVGIADPAARAAAFPFELSGGMAQRVMMACALSAGPDLLIADEPTSSLDVTVQAQILRLIDEERRRRDMAVLIITHDFAVVSALAERIAVMYAGRIVEQGPAARVLRSPQHPYTRALLACALLEPDAAGVLPAIAGAMTSARELACGCRFHPRCAIAAKAGVADSCCRDEPALAADGSGAECRCWAAAAGDGEWSARC